MRYVLALISVVVLTACHPAQHGRDLFDEVNAVRSEYGLPAVPWSEHMNDIALDHAERLAATDPCGACEWHRQRFPSWADPGLDYIGENIALADHDASDIVDAWMASPAHRAVILSNRWENGAVAVVDDGDLVWVVLNFGDWR